MKIIEKTDSNSIGSKEILFPGMEEVEQILDQVLMGADGIIKDMCISLLKSGGKRVRPIMVICSGLCFSQLTPEIINTAVAAELIHMASLIHDDIIDNSHSRRGKPTINSIYGNHAAVLAGDYVFAKAFSILSSYKLLSEMEYLVEAVQEMCDGEVTQAVDSYNTAVNINDYFKKIGKKTGILLSSCCRAGAAAAGAYHEDIEIMGQYGMNIGFAFQIIDDILDFTGDEMRTGKPKGMDIMNGNITLPVILLMENEKYGPLLKSKLKKGNILNQEFVYINELLHSTGALRKSFGIAEKCIAKSKSSIYSIPDSQAREALLQIADKVISREF